MPQARVAVVVIFQTRTRYVDECLAGIRALEGGPYPLILVPDAAVPDYEGLAVQAPLAAGIPQKRNRGLAEVPKDCEFVAFIDSDAYPQASWIVKALRRFEAADPRTAAVTGLAFTPPNEPWSRRASSHAMASALVVGKDIAANFDTRQALDATRNASTCNLIVRMSVLREIGGFDERLRTSEDVALSHEILARGWAMLRDPEVIVYHHSRDLPHFYLQWFNEGLALVQRVRMAHAGASLLVCLPSLLLCFELSLVALGQFPLLGILEAGQFGLFLFDRLRSGLPLTEAAGAALAMWGFPKAYGLGGLLSLFGGYKLHFKTRSDPPPT